MVKDIEWLKNEIKEYLEYEGAEDARKALQFVLDNINQLEEPNSKCETIRNLTQIRKIMEQRIEELEEEIESETNFYTFDDAKKWLEGNGYVVIEKPVIPKFMAESLEKAANDGVTLMRLMGIADSRLELDKYKKEYNWIRKYHETFAKAWIYGWEMEKEKLYIVKIPGLKKDGNNFHLCKTHESNVDWSPDEYIESKEEYQLTEKKIKSIHPVYWQFAEEVTE